jgi:hypothetical protein
MKGGNACFKTCKKSCKCRKLCNESFNDISFLKEELKNAQTLNEKLQKEVLEKLNKKYKSDFLSDIDKNSIVHMMTNPKLSYSDKNKIIQDLRKKYPNQHFESIGFHYGGRKTKRKGRKRKTRGGFFNFLNDAKEHKECEAVCEKNCETTCKTTCSSINSVIVKEIKGLEAMAELLDHNKLLQQTSNLLN